MPATPTARMVVAHLRECSELGSPMHPDVYRFLSDAADDPALHNLRNTACIQLSTPGIFAHPQTVFWQPTPLGAWAHQLPPERRSQQRFFNAVGVKESPEAPEIKAVLDAVTAAIGTDRIDDDAETVIHECWAALADDLHSSQTQQVMAELGRLRSMVDGHGLLAMPRHLYFRDGQALSDKFRLLAHNVIRREKRTWRALAAAGVGRAEDLFSIEPVELNAHADDVLPTLIDERRGAFQRVLEGLTDFEDQRINLDPISDLDVLRADTLQVEYRAELHSQVEVTTATPVDAVYIRDEHRLIYRTGAHPRARARELARALDPDGETAFMAMAIEQIIAAPSLEDAHRALDEYGIPDLDHVERGTALSQSIEDVDDSGGEGPAYESSGDAPGSEPEGPAASHDEPSEDVLAGEHSDHDRSQQGTRPQRQGDGTEDKPSDRATGERHTSSRSRKQSDTAPRSASQTRLRSYVVFGDDHDRGTRGDEEPDHSPVDRAGIKRVLEYERSCGRIPTEMPHENPGFDIESFDKTGALARRIEVKSTGSEWSAGGVMLSRRQHQQAAEDNELFWLYVVENSEDDENFAICRVQDPASRIDYFGFDDGWKVVAEPDIERDRSGTPTARSTRGLLSSSPGQAQAPG